MDKAVSAFDRHGGGANGSQCIFGVQLAVRETAKPAPRKKKKKHSTGTSQNRNHSEVGRLDLDGAKQVVETMIVFGIPIVGHGKDKTGP
jgi:hypothetical protein